MNANNIKQSLDQLIRTFGSVLESDAAIVIERAKSKLDQSKKRFDNYSRRTDNPALIPQPWGYSIPLQQPLRFIIAEPTHGFDAQLDISCEVLWEREDNPPVRQDIHLRLWNLQSSFRDNWDHPGIQAKINASKYGRVMLRYHFDLANESQPGPKYHIQTGGDPLPDEICWFPEIINLPRLAYPPMDLILACQLVVANFFPDEYQKLRKDPQWKNVVFQSQEHLLQSYYADCLKQIDSGQVILLDHLWNN